MTSYLRSYLALGRNSYVLVPAYVEIRMMFGSVILSRLTHRSQLGFPIFTYLHSCVTLMLERHNITTRLKEIKKLENVGDVEKERRYPIS